jgi:hypothetical protein
MPSMIRFPGRAGRRFGVAGLALAGALVLAAGAAGAHGAPAKGKPAKQAPHGRGPVTQQQAGSAQGIVQSVATKAVVVRELDGSSVDVPVAPSTRVFVDGRRGSLADVRPGFVASASWKAGKAASGLQAFDPSAGVALVVSVSPRAVVVTNAAGSRVTIRVTPRTRVLLDGKPSSLRAVDAGYTLVLLASGPGNRPATELRFLRPG